MGELEEKINSILSSPQEMEKIMGLARSLTGGGQDDDRNTRNEKSNFEKDDPSDLLGNIDPKMFMMMNKLLGESSHVSNEKAAILNSIKPFLKRERRDTLNRAADMAKMAKIAKIAFSEFSGGD